MPARLKASLAYPVTTHTSPPRTLETFLDAVTYLHEREQTEGNAEAGAAVDKLMMAAASEDPAEMERATRELDQLLAVRSW